MNKKSYLTPSQVAELLMVSPSTIRLWTDKGELAALTSPGGHRRFLPSEIERFALKRGLTLNNDKSKQFRILIIEDDEQFLRYLIALLENTNEDIIVDAASDGFIAGMRIQEFKPHVVLLDLMMPYLNGIQVCKRIKQNPQTASIRVLSMTGYPSASNVEAIMEAGAEICLKKPIDENILFKHLGLTRPGTVEHNQASE